jgi:hypothetical protein
MGVFGVNNSANNFGASAGLKSDTISNRPAQAAEGTLFIATDTLVMYRYNSTVGIWQQIGGGVVLSANNGLSIDNNVIKLGGQLQQYTEIWQNEYTIAFRNNYNSGNTSFYINPPKYNEQTGEWTAGIWHFGNDNAGQYELNDTNQCFLQILSGDGGTSYNKTSFVIGQDIDNNYIESGFIFDFINNSFQFGNIPEGNLIYLEDGGVDFRTNNISNGLFLGYSSNEYKFGNYNGISFYKNFISLTDGFFINSYENVYLIGNNTKAVLYLNNQLGIVYMGDTGGINNNCVFGIDDNNKTLYGTSNLLSTTAGGNTNQHLKIKIDGIDYKIQLKAA